MYNKSVAEQIDRLKNEFLKLTNESQNTVYNVSRLWTDKKQQEFYQKYMNSFIDVQKQTVRDIESLCFELRSIESRLNQLKQKRKQNKSTHNYGIR